MAEVFDRFLSPANAELMVMGDVDPAALRAAVLRTFGPVPRGVPPIPTFPTLSVGKL